MSRRYLPRAIGNGCSTRRPTSGAVALWRTAACTPPRSACSANLKSIPSHRSRETGEGGPERTGKERSKLAALTLDHRSTRERWSFFCARRRAALPIPADSVVDPAIGAHGPALLTFEDGTVFRGVAFGAPVAAGGDLVANTSSTGYQEICTDPSYAGQVVLMTYPLIGNYGRIAFDDQSRPAVAARPDRRPRHGRGARAGAPAGRAAQSLRACRRSPVWTRGALARRLRETGSQRVLISAPSEMDVDAAVDAARAIARWEDQDFVGQVSIDDAVRGRTGDGPLVAVVDYGLKDEHRPPARRPRGAGPRPAAHGRRARRLSRPTWPRLVLSPGPGDPARLDGPVRLAQAAIDDGRPLLGICLGHQIVGRAAGASTRRLRFGHHGANHPVRTSRAGSVQVTAQNHEVEVVGETLPAGERLHRQPAQPERRLGRGSAPRRPSRSRRSSTTPRARPARSTRSMSSIVSWPGSRWQVTAA